MEPVGIPWAVVVLLGGLVLVCLLGWAWTVRAWYATVAAWEREWREQRDDPWQHGQDYLSPHVQKPPSSHSTLHAFLHRVSVQVFPVLQPRSPCVQITGVNLASTSSHIAFAR